MSAPIDLTHRGRQGLRALLRLAGTGLLGLNLGLATAQSTAPGNAAGMIAQHEQQLQAIRQALLETTLEKAPTRVVSSAWVDEKGVLHESHNFRTGAEVRGVRVLSYLQDDENPRAQVSVDVLPWDLRPRQPDDSRCHKPARALRRAMVSNLELAQPLAGAQQAAAYSVLSNAHQHWEQLLQQSGQWTPLSWQPAPDNTYQRALLRSPGEDAHDWRAQLSLHAAAEPAKRALLPGGLDLWSPPAAWRWTLTLHISQRMAGANTFREVARQQMALQLDPRTVADHPQRGLQPFHEQVQVQLARWLQELQTLTRCEATQFTVRREPNTALLLQAGAASGLRAGDRVLLMQPGWVPSRLLDSGALEHLALAEVVHTGQRLTELRQLAGPSVPAHGEWVALPL